MGPGWGRVFGVVGLLVGCSSEPKDGSPMSAADYAGRPELHLEFGVSEDTGGLALGDPWFLRLDEESWEGRHGESWGLGAWLGAWTAAFDDGLWLEDAAGERVNLLPDRLSQGATGEGVEVTALGEVSTWYGTFDDTVTVEVSEGDWAGTQVFARDFGLVLWTLGGETRELAYYE